MIVFKGSSTRESDRVKRVFCSFILVLVSRKQFFFIETGDRNVKSRGEMFEMAMTSRSKCSK